MKITKLKEKPRFSETYRISLRKLTTDYHFKLNREIERCIKLGKPAIDLINELNTITTLKKLIEVQNLLPTVGRAAIADHLTNASPSPASLRINDVALGDDGTTPANGDTTLGNEVYRNEQASQTNTDNVAYVTGFFSATETTGTYAEVGLFINGSGTGNPDTGTLFSHALISITKTSTETLTIDYTITLS